MAINDIVQTIAEARVDARSLSEFVFKPAGFKVTRRLAPVVDTLQFYINRFNSLNGDFSSSVSVALSSLNSSVAEADGKVAYIETTVQDAINNTAIEGGVLADTFVTVTANGVGTVARSQRDKNSEVLSIEDFGGDFLVAAEWLKGSNNRYCKLLSGVEYTLPSTPTGQFLYFNRYYAVGGKAIVNHISGNNLECVTNSTNGGNVFLENIELRVAGKRTSIDNTIPPLFVGWNNPQDDIYINNLVIKGLKSIDDATSWVDDVGRTRCCAIFSLYAKSEAVIKNVKTYGVGALFTLRSSSPSASHDVSNCISYNAETVGFIVGEFDRGSCKDMYIYNTKVQQGYWSNQTAKPYPNGKCVLVTESNYTRGLLLGDIIGENVIERSLYIQSDNVSCTNVRDIQGRSIAHFKRHFNTDPLDMKGTVHLSNLIAETDETAPEHIGDGTHKRQGMEISGYAKAVYSNLNLESITRTREYPIITSGTKDILIRDSTIVRMAGVLFSSGHSETITISNVVLKDCYSPHAGDAGQIYGGNQLATGRDVGEIYLNSVKSLIADPLSVASQLHTCVVLVARTQLLSISDCVGHSKGLPISARNPLPVTGLETKVDIQNSKFYQCSIQFSTSRHFERLFDKLDGANYIVNTCDFLWQFESTLDVIPIKTILHIKNNTDYGSVRVLDYWRSIESEVNLSSGLTVGAATEIRLIRPTGSSFEVSASYKGSNITFWVDVASNVMNNPVIRGTFLTNTKNTNSNMLEFYMDNTTGFLALRVPTAWDESEKLVSIKYTRYG